MLVKDHQQETARWVVGIIDGEGSFEQHPNYPDSISVNISNTDLDIMQKCQQYFNTVNVRSVFWEETRRTVRGKIAYRLRINSSECRDLYKILLPYLECRFDAYYKIVGSSETVCEKSLTSDLYWLIGIWEAEGCHSLLPNTRTRHTRYHPRCQLGNTNIKITNKIELTLSTLGLAFHCRDTNPLRGKPATIINIQGMLRVKRFLEKTKGLWVARRNIKRTDLLSEFIQSRLSNLDENAEYSDRELQIYQTMKDLNH